MIHHIEHSYLGTKSLYVVLFVLLFTASCKKTEYEQIQRPYNSIEVFSIGGYGDLDSISAVIKDNDIIVYWSADADLPATITPHIKVSAGAVVSPASGTAVAFSETTVYTVTAEDGTERQYILKPVQMKAIPVLAGFSNESTWNWAGPDWQWGKGKKLKINGEYFLHYNDASGIRVYAQRIRDGFEFDLAVDPEETTSTAVAVDLPRLTAELDSGMHRIFVQVGDYPSNSLEVWIAPPAIADIATMTLKEAGQTIHIGDVLHYTITVDETKMEPDLFEKYYNNDSYYYYQARVAYLDDERYSGVIVNDAANDLPIENRAVVNGKEITIPVTEYLWGSVPGVHIYDNNNVYLESELFLKEVQFQFNTRNFQEPTNNLTLNRSNITAPTSTDSEVSRRTRFEHRE